MALGGKVRRFARGPGRCLPGADERTAFGLLDLDDGRSFSRLSPPRPSNHPSAQPIKAKEVKPKHGSVSLPRILQAFFRVPLHKSTTKVLLSSWLEMLSAASVFCWQASPLRRPLRRTMPSSEISVVS